MGSLVDDMLDLLGAIIFLGVCLAVSFGVIVNLMYQQPSANFLIDKTAPLYQGETPISSYDGTLSKLQVILLTQIQDYNMPEPRHFVVASTTGGSPADINIDTIGPDYSTSYDLQQYGNEVATVLEGDTSNATQYQVGFVPDSAPDVYDGYYTIAPLQPISGTGVPIISNVTWGGTTWSPSLTITGTNLGSYASVTTQDDTTNWISTPTSGVQPQIASSTSTKLVISGFNGYGSGDDTFWSDGLGSWSFRPGDQVTITYQDTTGQTTQYTTTYPSSPMPTVSIAHVSSQPADSTVTLSGTVSFNGTPLANQAVVLTSSSGFFTPSGSYVADNPNEFMVFTDANGDWTASYTTPSTPNGATVQIKASSAGQPASTTFDVAPTVASITTFPQGMDLGTVSVGPNDLFTGWLGQPYGAPGAMWNTPNSDQAASNGTPLIFETTVNTTGTSLNFDIGVDDLCTTYVDGIPQRLTTYNTTTDNFSVGVSPGQHLIQIFAENTAGQNPVTDNPPNPAGLWVQITDNTGALLASTATEPSAWQVLQPTQGASYFEPYLFQGTNMTPGNWNPSASFYSASGLPTGPSQITSGVSVPEGSSVVIAGQLDLRGVPQANQPITISVDSGSLSAASTGGQNPSGDTTTFSTTTNSQGEWTVTYTAPFTTGSLNMTVSGGGASQNSLISVT